MAKFGFEGTLGKGRGGRKFGITVEGNTEAHARQSAYARLGADHRLKRSQIKIEQSRKL